MMWIEFDKYARENLAEGLNNAIDWRPAAAFQINDIVKVENGEAFIPLGIRYWLANGDSIIYVRSHE